MNKQATYEQTGQLILFARAPVIGQVKSRIARQAGKQAALSIYQQLLDQLFHQFSKATKFQVCCYTDQPDHAYFLAYKKQGIHFYPQQGKNLGQRMFNALSNQIKNFPAVVLIGSDCPALTPTLIEEAFIKLSTGYQAVITPAEDGGYVLIGFSGSLYPDIFEDIAWGSEKVLEQTRQKFTRSGLNFCQLEALADIDTFEAYQSWRKNQSE
jgi:rSAM/selenodomain-associated transferase 1